VRNVMLKVMLTEAKRFGIDIERVGQERTHISHRLLALP